MKQSKRSRTTRTARPRCMLRMVRPTEELVTKLSTEVAANFPCFGGGRASSYNPLSIMLADKPPQFAAGVHVSNVVRFILERASRPNNQAHRSAPP